MPIVLKEFLLLFFLSFLLILEWTSIWVRKAKTQGYLLIKVAEISLITLLSPQSGKLSFLLRKKDLRQYFSSVPKLSRPWLHCRIYIMVLAASNLSFSKLHLYCFWNALSCVLCVFFQLCYWQHWFVLAWLLVVNTKSLTFQKMCKVILLSLEPNICYQLK